MVCPSFWIRRLRHHKRSGQLSYSQSGRVASHKRSVLLSGFVVFVLGSVISREVWPFAGIHRFKRWSKPRTKGLAICRRKGGGRAREKRSVLLSRFVVFVAGSVRSPEVSQEVCPFVDWPFAGIRRFCRGFAPLTRGLGICRPGRKGLSFCRDSSCSSRVWSSHQRSRKRSGQALKRSVHLSHSCQCRAIPAQAGRTHRMRSPAHIVLRAIPAQAGRTSAQTGKRSGPSGHPRAGGENGLPSSFAWICCGPSPRRRGERSIRVMLMGYARAIPAQAGRTRRDLRGFGFALGEFGPSPRRRGERI